MLKQSPPPHHLMHPNTHNSKGGWNAAFFIIFVEVAERFAYYGIAGNLITYLTNNLHQPIAMAAKNVNAWVGVSAIFPILGALLADSFLGRFWTVLLASIIYFLGTVLLTFSVSIIPKKSSEAVFFLALYILAVGEGAHKPSVQTFAFDQFNEDEPEEKAAKSSFFNWWYLCIVFAASVAVSTVIYIQDNVGWAAGFGISAGAVAVGLVMFLVGIKKYRKQAPVGSPFTTIARVVVAAIRKRNVDEVKDGLGICLDEEINNSIQNRPGGSKTLVRTKKFRFLDRAMIINSRDAASKPRNPWRLCTLNQVEEVKLVIQLIPIWLSCIIFAGTMVQTHTFFIKQGSTMIRSIGPHFQVPPASLQSLTGLTILINVPIYDRVFVPFMRKLTGHPSGITMLQRIGIGLFLSALEMVVAGTVETQRLRIARDHNLINTPKAIVPMSLWWLLPQYMVSGLADVFTIVGLQELFYDQMPESMRSIGASAYISVVGVGSFVNNAIIIMVQEISGRFGEAWLGDNINRARLDYYYWVLAILSVIGLGLYVWVSSCFVYKKVEGHVRK